MRNFGCYRSPICLSPDPDPENKPGGGGNENGGFSEDQLKAIGGMVNQVVTSHLKRQPTLADQLKEVKWSELLEPVVKGLVPQQQETKTEPGKKPELSEYEKQLAKLTSDFQNAEKARVDAENRAKAAETARKVDAGKLKLRSALTGQVNDGALDHVINHLTVVTNRLIVDEDGNAKLKVKRPEFPGSPPVEMEISIDDAVKDILSESDMKIFLPPPKGASGSNAGPGGKITSSSQFTGEAKTDEERTMRAMVRERELFAKYGNGNN